jgi:low temperature requirement protein LtrA
MSGPPFRIFSDIVTWTELFFDLIFVGAVAQVGAPLAHDYSLGGLLRYVFLFLLIWSAWSEHTLYTSRFDHDDLVHRVLILVQRFIAAVMAANARDALDSRSSAGFGAAYAGMRIILVIQYLRVRGMRETRQLTTRYAAGFALAAALWMVSSLLNAPARYWVWSVALAIDVATPLIARKEARFFPPDPHYFPERLGLFTIILLGEFVAGVMRGIEHHGYWTATAAPTAFLSMAFALVVRWWYFDVARIASERDIRSRRQSIVFQIWHCAHLPLYLGIGVAGVGFERMISLTDTERLSHDEALLLCAAVALLTRAVAISGATSRRPTRKAVLLQLALALSIAVTGFVGHALNRVVVAVILVGICTAKP